MNASQASRIVARLRKVAHFEQTLMNEPDGDEYFTRVLEPLYDAYDALHPGERTDDEDPIEGGDISALATEYAGLLEDEYGIPTTNEIASFFHCAECLKSLPADSSPRDWASLEVGFTPLGVQVWCKRHESNVIHIDFQGQRHPAV